MQCRLYCIRNAVVRDRLYSVIFWKPSSTCTDWNRYKKAALPVFTAWTGGIGQQPDPQRWKLEAVQCKTWKLNVQSGQLGSVREFDVRLKDNRRQHTVASLLHQFHSSTFTPNWSCMVRLQECIIIGCPESLYIFTGPVKTAVEQAMLHACRGPYKKASKYLWKVRIK